MVVPTLAFLLIFQYYPAVSGLYRSLFDWNAGLEGTFIGLANFIELFTDDEVFIRSLKNMALLTIWYLFAFVGLSTGVAVLIHRIRHDGSKYFFRLFMILPVIIPAVVLILLWKFIYDSTIGPLNTILIGVGLQDWTHAWLAEPKIAIYAVMLRNFPWIDGISVLISAGRIAGNPGRDHRKRPSGRRQRLEASPLHRTAPHNRSDQTACRADHHVGRAGVHGRLGHDARRADRLNPGAGNVDVFQRLPHQPHGLRLRDWGRHVPDHPGGDDSKYALHKIPGILTASVLRIPCNSVRNTQRSKGFGMERRGESVAAIAGGPAHSQRRGLHRGDSWRIPALAILTFGARG